MDAFSSQIRKEYLTHVLSLSVSLSLCLCLSLLYPSLLPLPQPPTDFYVAQAGLKFSYVASDPPPASILSPGTTTMYHYGQFWAVLGLSLIHIRRCRRIAMCRNRWSPYH